MEDVISQLQHQLSQVQEEVQACSGSWAHYRLSPQPPVHPSKRRRPQHSPQHSPSLQYSLQPNAQFSGLRSHNLPQSWLSPLIPRWTWQQRPSPATSAQQPQTDVEEAPVSATGLPDEQRRRKCSADVVMYGHLGDSSAHLRQTAQEGFQALNLLHAGSWLAPEAALVLLLTPTMSIAKMSGSARKT